MTARAQYWRFGVIAILAVMLGVAILALRDELAVRQADALTLLDPPRAYALFEDGRLMPQGPLVPRVAMPTALAQARAAFGSYDGGARARLLTSARVNLDTALAARPAWGDARVAETYMDFVEKGVGHADTRNAFATSYVEAPYLAEAAPWRLAYGNNQWEALSPVTQSHMLDEAAWYGRTADNYRLINEILTNDDARQRFRDLHARLAAQEN